MDTFKSVMTALLLGMRDSLCGTVMVFHLDRAQGKAKMKKSTSPQEPSTLAQRRTAQKSKLNTTDNEEPSILYRILQCCALNGGVFWISILLFHNLFLPALHYVTHLMYDGSSEAASAVWSWVMLICSCTFGTFWVLPLFLLSKIVNSLWFQDIANSAYKHSRGRPQLLSSISMLIADILFSVVIQALFLVQSTIVTFLPLPIIGRLVCLLHMCLLYSLYAFEYKWLNMGWELHKRLSFIESNWPYFVGFGLPLAVLTALPTSYVISGCVFSILFPLFIISGNTAEPITGSCDYPLQLFSPVVYLSNVIFNRTMGSKSGDNAKPSTGSGSLAARQRSGIAYRR